MNARTYIVTLIRKPQSGVAIVRRADATTTTTRPLAAVERETCERATLAAFAQIGIEWVPGTHKAYLVRRGKRTPIALEWEAP